MKFYIKSVEVAVIFDQYENQNQTLSKWFNEAQRSDVVG